MKCPRCKTVNDKTRTICTKCGYYLYRNDSTPRARMTPEERRRADMLEMWTKTRKVLRVIWRILVFLVMTFWIIAVIVYIASFFGFNLM